MSKYLDLAKCQTAYAAYAKSCDHETDAGDWIEAAVECGYFDIRRFFGSNPLDPKGIAIAFENSPFSFADPLISEFATKAQRMLRREGRLTDGPPATSLMDMALDADTPWLRVQPCDYALQAGSCFALDLTDSAFGSSETLRNYFLEITKSHRVADNPLAICLGVCGILTTRDGQMLLVRRSANLASLESSIGPSVAGSVDFERHWANLSQMSCWALADEVEEEVKLDRGQYQITPLAIAREILRGERPQIFCLIECDLDQPALQSHLQKLGDRTSEFDRWQLTPVSADPGQSEWLTELNLEAGMNLKLVREYLGGKDQAEEASLNSK